MSLLALSRDLVYVGGYRFGVWFYRGQCPEHDALCSGITRSHRHLEVSVRGRSLGLCW